MWFNLDVLKLVIKFYQKIVYWRSFLLILRINQQWKLNTIFFNKQFYFKLRFAYKLKKLIIDHQNYFWLQQKKLKYFDSFLKEFNSVFFLLLFYTNIDLNIISQQQYNNLNIKLKLLNKKYVLLLKQKELLKLQNNDILFNIFLLYQNFYLSEKLLINIDNYIFKSEIFLFCFKKLEYFLKYFFLRKCPLKLKLKIWDDCRYTVDEKVVFFEEKSIWLKNLEIFDENNILFFNKIPLNNAYFIWDVFKSKIKNKIDNNFKYLYYKYRYLNETFEFFSYKLNYLKKKFKIIQFFLFLQNSKNNFLNLNLKNKKLIKNLNEIFIFFQNRNKLLKLIYDRRKFFKNLKKNSYLELITPKNILSNEKKYILYKLFCISCWKVLKEQFLKFSMSLADLRRNFQKWNKLKIKTINNLKFLFYLYYKLRVELHFKSFKDKWKFFLFNFFFFFFENFLIKNNLLTLEFFFTRENFTEDDLKFYNLNNIDNYLFNHVWNLLIYNFAFEIDNNITKRYNLLNFSLYKNYKKNWFFLNKKKFATLKILENLVISKFSNILFFNKNIIIFQKVFELYKLLSYTFLNLTQSLYIINMIMKFLEIVLKKNKKQISKKNKYYLKKNRYYLKKKKFNNIFFFSLLQFLKKKINKYKIKLKDMYYLYIFLKKSIIKIHFKKLLFFFFENKYKIFSNLNLNKRKFLLFLKLIFNQKTSFFFFLEKSRVKILIKNYKKLVLSLFYIYLLTKFKYKKFNNYNKSYEKIKFYILIVWKKNFLNIIKKFLKKTLFIKNYINYKYIYNKHYQYINNLNQFLYKKFINIYSLTFLIYVWNQLFDYFFFIFKNHLINDVLINLNTHFLSTISFFDLKNDYTITKKNLFFKLRGDDVKKKFFFSKKYKIKKKFWIILKNNLYLEKLNLLINRRLIFIAWFNFINNDKIWYKELDINDYLFVLRMEHKEFYLNYPSTIQDKRFRSEVAFLPQLCLSYFSYFEKDIWDNRNNEISKYLLVNRQLKNINLVLTSFNFYIKQNFFNLIKLRKFNKIKYKYKYSKRNFISNIYFNAYNYINNYLNLDKQNLKNKINIKFNIVKDLAYFCCKNCSCLSINNDYKNKIIYYQKFLKINKLNENLLKFKFIFCSLCNKYKLSLKENDVIPYFSTYEDIIKYFLKKNIFDCFIFFQNKIKYCFFYKRINFIIFDDINLLTLIVNNYELKFFFCYFKSKHKYSFNIKSYIFDFKFYYYFCNLIMLFIINLFFEDPENRALVIPQMVKLYNFVLILLKEIRVLNHRMDMLKLYRKKNHIKITKKMKKERKLYHLNRFFDAIIELHKKEKNEKEKVNINVQN